MKFAPCSWKWTNLRGWSPQRLAAARRAVQKESARVQSKRDEVGLFPELQEAIQPRFNTVEERQAIIDRGELWWTSQTRQSASEKWRAGRAAFYRLPRLRRRGMRRLWNRNNLPKSPTSFAVFVEEYSAPGKSPWTYLRKLRLLWLWNHGGWSKPAHFRVITASFPTLGPVPQMRTRDQSIIQLAKLRGESPRDVKKALRL